MFGCITLGFEVASFQAVQAAGILADIGFGVASSQSEYESLTILTKQISCKHSKSKLTNTCLQTLLQVLAIRLLRICLNLRKVRSIQSKL